MSIRRPGPPAAVAVGTHAPTGDTAGIVADADLFRQVDWVVAGRVTRAHGVHGELRLSMDVAWEQMRPLSGLCLQLDEAGARRLAAARASAGASATPASSATMAPLRLDLALVSARLAGDDVLVQLVGIDRRELAAALRGAQVRVPRDSLPALEPGEVWGFELVGLDAIDEAGSRLGRVTAVDGRGPQLVARLQADDGALALVPMVAGVMLAVRRSTAQVVLRLPLGLWGL